MAEIGLTDDEHEAMGLTADLWNLMVQRVVGRGESRDQDLAELAADIHSIQHRIMAQAAARAHPEFYRLLGADGIKPHPASVCPLCGSPERNARDCPESWHFRTVGH